MLCGRRIGDADWIIKFAKTNISFTKTGTYFGYSVYSILSLMFCFFVDEVATGFACRDAIMGDGETKMSVYTKD